MKKIIAALVASVMMVGFTAPTFAAINPTNIDESSSKVNIYKKVWKQVNEKDIHAGVVGFFAWVHIDGTIYSVALSQLRKHGDPSKAFADIVGVQVAADQAANLVGALENVVDSNSQKIVEIREVERIVTVLVEVMGPERIVEIERIVTERVEVEVEVIREVIRTVTNTVTVEVPGPTITIDNTDNSRIAELEEANTELRNFIGTWNPEGEDLDNRQFLNSFSEVYQGVAMTYGFDAIPEDSFRGLTGSLAVAVSNLHHALMDIDQQLDTIKMQIDRAAEVELPGNVVNEFGFSSSLDWDALTTVEKATRIADKLPEIIGEFSILASQVNAAGAANVGFVATETGWEVRLPTSTDVTFNTVLENLRENEEELGINLANVVDADTLAMAIEDALLSAQTSERTTIIGRLNQITGVDIANDASNARIKTVIENAIAGAVQLAVPNAVLYAAQRDAASDGIFAATGVRIMFGAQATANQAAVEKAINDAIARGVTTPAGVVNALEAAAAANPFLSYTRGQELIPFVQEEVRERLDFELPAGQEFGNSDFFDSVRETYAPTSLADVVESYNSRIINEMLHLDAMTITIEQAIHEAYNHGYQDGYAEGYKDGFHDGYAAGAAN